MIKNEAVTIPAELEGSQESPPISDPIRSLDQLRLGELLLKEGLISEVQLLAALRLQKELSQYKPLGQILIEQQAITTSQLNILLNRHHKRLRLGEILLKTKAITKEELYIALELQKKNGRRLGETLLELGYITEDVLLQAIGMQFNIPTIDLDNFAIDARLTKLINKKYARKHLVVPIAKVASTITLALKDPTAVAVIEELQSSTGMRIKVVTSTRAAIERALTRLYGEEASEEREPEITHRLELISEVKQEAPNQVRLDEDPQQRRADEIVRAVIGLGMNHHATDIHLETLSNRTNVRFRIDGVLQAIHLGSLEKAIDQNRKAIISRIKILGEMDIAERRRPQDGSFRAKVERNGGIEEVDFRISMIPGYFGENVVLRVLDPRNAPRSLADLGFSDAISGGLQELLRRPAGMILITGPTGSGKSTTLAAALMTLYRPGIKILTAEDPIEYVHQGMTQCEVNEKIGNTFSAFLRAFLRHDPQVIMLGEIRDAESATLASRAAQTGHLVLSTLHTKDAISSITRLLDLDIEAGLITSSLLGVFAQRLVRKICPECKEEYSPPGELLKEFFSVPPSSLRWYKGKGCRHCNFTGYKGRMPVAELWIPSNNDIILINKGAPFDEIRASSHRSTIFMAEDAKEKLREGQTTLEELIRTLPYFSIHQFRNISI